MLIHSFFMLSNRMGSSRGLHNAQIRFKPVQNQACKHSITQQFKHTIDDRLPWKPKSENQHSMGILVCLGNCYKGWAMHFLLTGNFLQIAMAQGQPSAHAWTGSISPLSSNLQVGFFFPNSDSLATALLLPKLHLLSISSSLHLSPAAIFLIELSWKANHQDESFNFLWLWRSDI